MSDRKNIVSIRISNSDKSSVQSIAERLFVRESDVYRFAVIQLLTRLDKFLDESCGGRDLLPVFLELREEINQNLRLKKDQLYTILNGNETSPDKYVSMADVELLLLPHHAMRKRLSRIHQPPEKNIDSDTWLKIYFAEKYFPEGQFDSNFQVDHV